MRFKYSNSSLSPSSPQHTPVRLAINCYVSTPTLPPLPSPNLHLIIVSRGDWLGKPANIKVENNSAAVYVGSSLTVRNPLFFVHKL